MKRLLLQTGDGRVIGVDPHPATGGILAKFPVGTVIEFGDGQPFIVGHRGPHGLVIVPITAEEAERICSSDAPTTTASPVN
jgi:hypothetical protein